MHVSKTLVVLSLALLISLCTSSQCSSEKQPTSTAQVILPTKNIHSNIEFFKTLEFRLTEIFPSDDPQTAIMSGHGLTIRLEKDSSKTSSRITIQITTNQHPLLTNNTRTHKITAPNECTITITRPSSITFTPTNINPQFDEPIQIHSYDSSSNSSWIIGRAGMLYRDLIPNRLGHTMIASHIYIPKGGPVPDYVHYHSAYFQLSYCYQGWVRLVYEDQGPPFILKAGDLVTQPMGIRHEVLESSDDLHVIEIALPEEYTTFVDHDMKLPNDLVGNPDRIFENGHGFCHSKKEEGKESDGRVGWKSRETCVARTTRNEVDVVILRRDGGKKSVECEHDGKILFGFVLNGGLDLGGLTLKKDDAFVVETGRKFEMTRRSDDLEILEVRVGGEVTCALLL